MKSISIHKGRTNSPCFECKDHSGTCRSGCEKWKEWEKVHAKEREAINKKKHEYSLGFGAPYRTDREWNNVVAAERRAEARVFKQSMK